MNRTRPIPLDQWIAHKFTVQGRGDFVALLAPLFSPYVRPGARVLDLCCGAGPFSFYFEERGGNRHGHRQRPLHDRPGR